MNRYVLLISILLLAQSAVSQVCRDTILPSTPDNRFNVNGNEVLDTATGLIWQRCALGQTEDDCSGGIINTYNWQEALRSKNALWRLPNVKELRSIVEEKCSSPAINLSVFPNTIPGDYWSASRDAGTPERAWYASFGGGGSQMHGKSNRLYVRLVRDGQ